MFLALFPHPLLPPLLYHVIHHLLDAADEGVEGTGGAVEAVADGGDRSFDMFHLLFDDPQEFIKILHHHRDLKNQPKRCRSDPQRTEGEDDVEDVEGGKHTESWGWQGWAG